jgi:fructose-bisphosphate aldolase class II
VSEIRQLVDIPLVMHGGTGLSDEQFRGAIAAGISKINYFTNIMHTATQDMQAACGIPGVSMFQIYECIRPAYARWCSQLYEVFGTARRA